MTDLALGLRPVFVGHCMKRVWFSDCSPLFVVCRRDFLQMPFCNVSAFMSVLITFCYETVEKSDVNS